MGKKSKGGAARSVAQDQADRMADYLETLAAQVRTQGIASHSGEIIQEAVLVHVPYYPEISFGSIDPRSGLVDVTVKLRLLPPRD